MIVDEFHHAAAHVLPRAARARAAVELLGPHGDAGAQRRPAVLDWFDDRIAAELRLWDAIDQHRLVAVRLLRHPRRARSARHALAARPGLRRRGALEPVHGERRLGRRRGRAGRAPRRRPARDARARLLRERRARAVHGARVPRGRRRGDRGLGRQPDDERRSALRDCRTARQRRVLGRPLQRRRRRPGGRHAAVAPPTESPTLFLQQLGRGLRRHPPKTVVHGPRLRRSPSLRVPIRSPLPRAARRHPPARSRRRSSRVSRSFPRAATWSSTASRARSCSRASAGRCLRDGARRSKSCASLAKGAGASRSALPRETGLELEDIYAGDKSWSDLAGRGPPVRPPGPTRRLSGAPAAASSTSTTSTESRPTGVCCSADVAPDLETLSVS